MSEQIDVEAELQKAIDIFNKLKSYSACHYCEDDLATVAKATDEILTKQKRIGEMVSELERKDEFGVTDKIAAKQGRVGIDPLGINEVTSDLVGAAQDFAEIRESVKTPLAALGSAGKKEEKTLPVLPPPHKLIPPPHKILEELF